MKTTLFILLSISTVFQFNSVNAEEPNTKLSISILELMQKVITPATNTLWSADPQNEEDWLALEQAAYTTIAAATITGIGGSGPQDTTWVNDPVYQAFNQAMLTAGISSLKAIKAKDLDALFEAGDALYSPCEACHLQFNPAVINQPQ